MKCFFVLLVFPFVVAAQPKQTVLKDIQQTVFSKTDIYLVCRGTKSKAGFIARQFNRLDTMSTHVGIGLSGKGSFYVYHVPDRRDDQAALTAESISSFISGQDVYYLSIWKCKSTKEEITGLQKLLVEQRSKKIIFDMSFRLDNGDTLYCSEFCARLLENMSPRRFKFQPAKKELNSLYATLLKQKQLIYYPVDFFRSNNEFVLFREYYLQD